MKNNAWLNYFYPPIEKANSYFNNPQLINEMINSFGGTSGINSMSKIIPAMKQVTQKSINPLMSTELLNMYKPIEENYMGNIKNIFTKKSSNLGWMPPHYEGDILKESIYDPFRRESFGKSEIEEMINFSRNSIKEIMENYHNNPRYKFYKNPKALQSINKHKDIVDHYIDLLNGGPGTLK